MCLQGQNTSPTSHIQHFLSGVGVKSREMKGVRDFTKEYTWFILPRGKGTLKHRTYGF